MKNYNVTIYWMAKNKKQAIDSRFIQSDEESIVFEANTYMQNLSHNPIENIERCWFEIDYLSKG